MTSFKCKYGVLEEKPQNIQQKYIWEKPPHRFKTPFTYLTNLYSFSFWSCFRLASTNNINAGLWFSCHNFLEAEILYHHILPSLNCSFFGRVRHNYRHILKKCIIKGTTDCKGQKKDIILWCINKSLCQRKSFCWCIIYSLTSLNNIVFLGIQMIVAFTKHLKIWQRFFVCLCVFVCVFWVFVCWCAFCRIIV